MCQIKTLGGVRMVYIEAQGQNGQINEVEGCEASYEINRDSGLAKFRGYPKGWQLLFEGGWVQVATSLLRDVSSANQRLVHFGGHPL
jgi:hypothetical protein